jgi:hypothetical protein
MSIDRSQILCMLAIVAGLLPFSGCGSSDKPATDPGAVNVVVDHVDHVSTPSKTLPAKIVDDPKTAHDAAKQGATNVNK